MSIGMEGLGNPSRPVFWNCLLQLDEEDWRRQPALEPHAQNIQASECTRLYPEKFPYYEGHIYYILLYWIL